MSRLIGTIEHTGVANAAMDLTEFVGPQDLLDTCGSRSMLQISQGMGLDTSETGYIQLTVEDARQLVRLVNRWIRSTRSTTAADSTKDR